MEGLRGSYKAASLPKEKNFLPDKEEDGWASESVSKILEGKHYFF
jgi:hypothetical protein